MRGFKMPRSFYTPKNATKVADKATDVVCYFATFHHRPSNSTRYHLVGFAGKGERPLINYSIRNTAELERTIREFFASRQQIAAYKAQQREARKAFVHTVQVGDIYSTCWGYDQTNVEFFEIVEVRGKYAILREIASASEDNGKGSERCVPQSGAFLSPRYEGDDRGLPIRRLIQEGRIKIDDVRTANKWGQRVAGVLVGNSMHRTAAGWGH